MHDPVELAHLLRHAAANAALYGAAATRIGARARRTRGTRAREERLVFVVGSPRSGTTFVARALGALPDFVDLGEVKPWKAAIPQAVELQPHVAGALLRTILERVRRLGAARGLRGVEQTPETSFVLPAVLAAYPEAAAVHVVRDGRDVVSSLLERAWLSAGRGGHDDVGASYGSQPRFWVEPERREEFRETSDAARAAWAWRRYVEAARSVPSRTIELRYEELVAAPAAVAERVAREIEADAASLVAAFSRAVARSRGRWRRDLAPDAVADVEREAGALLRELGY